MSDLSKPGDPRADYLDARMRWIHALAEQGHSPEQIAAKLNEHDPGQVRLILATDPDKAVPSSTRWRYLRLYGAFELLGVAHRYVQGQCDWSNMSCQVQDIVERMP